MAITLKQLQGHLPSPQEQEDFAHQANVAITHLLPCFAQQFEDVQKAALSCFAQQIQLMQKTFGVGERYSKPAYISPPLYLRQSQPQIRYIIIDDLPGLN